MTNYRQKLTVLPGKLILSKKKTKNTEWGGNGWSHVVSSGYEWLWVVMGGYVWL